MGDRHLHGWVDTIETGDVISYDPDEVQFVSLAHYDYPLAEAPRCRRIPGTI